MRSRNTNLFTQSAVCLNCRRGKFPVLYAAIGLCLLTSLTATRLFAQESADTPAPKQEAPEPPRVPFSKAFADAPFSRSVIAMALGDDEAAVLPKGEYLEKIIPLFRKKSRRFGLVLAVGPEKLDVLETDFSKMNIFADIPPEQALTLLMGKLSDGQRNKLMSKDGLGLSDLSDPMQKQLFQIILPGGAMNNGQNGENGEGSTVTIPVSKMSWELSAPNFRQYESPVNASDELTISAEQMANARLHIEREVQTTFQIAEGEKGLNPGDFATFSPYKSNIYSLSWTIYESLDSVNGVRIRSQRDNTPKHGDLNINRTVFQSEVPLNDLKTIADLMAALCVRL